MCTKKCFACVGVILVASNLASAEVLAPPPPPEIPPIISDVYPEDQNGDRIDDSLQVLNEQNRVVKSLSVATDEAIETTDSGDSMTNVELIFKDQITQQQIDRFLELDGEITYIYKSVSYGWNGRIPARQIEKLPSLMGATLVQVLSPKKIVSYMDQATQTGRVRPVWQAGFAGSINGYSGDPNITIAIIDTGVDANHPDLAGRCVYWKDYSGEDIPYPVDYGQHGTLVAGVALGSGQAGGSDKGTLYYTTSPIVDPCDHPSLYNQPIYLPETESGYTFTANALWEDAEANFSLLEWPEGMTVMDALAGPGLTLLAPNQDGEITVDLPGRNGYVYLPDLEAIGDANLVDPVITSSVTNYPGSTDGFNRFRGVAPLCSWAGAKVEKSDGTGDTAMIGRAIDDLVNKRQDYNIKVINLSVGPEPGVSSTGLQSKINSASNRGILVVVAAGNNGEYSNGNRGITDPGLEQCALTVVATNDKNALTSYSAQGPTTYTKPDIAAPGGSKYYSGILTPDSDSSDGYGVPDAQPADYQCVAGTSFSSPFVAGAAALVIEAMEENGIDWAWARSSPMFVKAMLCATASETGLDRENGLDNPFLQGAAPGDDNYPASKDHFEGYGIINPDAAIEAVSLEYVWGNISDTLGEGPSDRRVWARKVVLSRGANYTENKYFFELDNPPTGDFDLYLYEYPAGLSGFRSRGEPIISASSSKIGFGRSEQISYSAPSEISRILIIKRASGYGEFTLRSICALKNNVPETALGLLQRYYFTPVNTAGAIRSWTGIGVNASTDHDISIFPYNDPNTVLAKSEDKSETASDFVMINKRSNWPIYYAEVYGNSLDNYQIESDLHSRNLSTGREFPGSIDPGEVLEIYEVSVTLGKTYNLTLDIRNGNADLGAYVFSSTRQYYGSRTDHDGAASDAGPGEDENMAFTADDTGEYGIAVINENGGTCSYSISCYEID